MISYSMLIFFYFLKRALQKNGTETTIDLKNRGPGKVFLYNTEIRL